jgi:DNA-binding NtrC family response regulator
MSCDVLIIHERAEVRDLLAAMVIGGGCRCRTAADCASAMREIACQQPSLVLLAGSLDECPSETRATLERLIAEHCATPVIAIGRPRNDELGRRAMLRVIKDAVADSQWRSKVTQPEVRAA